MRRVTTSKARYIKLGPAGAWEKICIEEGILRLGHSEIPHELAMSGDRNEIRQCFIELGVTPAKASDKTREILAFYDGDEDVVWITFSNGFLWWCQAAKEVLNGLGHGNHDGGRWRRSRYGWSNKSVAGAPLLIGALSGRLTRTAGYRQNICDVADRAYLLQRINDEMSPSLEAAIVARQTLTSALVNVIRSLSWQDFELFVDLIFSTSGWRRTGSLGGTQKTVDIELELPFSGERAFVQIKAATTQAELDRYAADFAERAEGRMFFAYHSTTEAGLVTRDDKVTVLGPSKLAEMALSSGLTDWLINKVS